MKKKILIISLSVLVVIIIAARIALPYIAKTQILKSLNKIEGYNATLEGVGIALYRGAFQIHNLTIYEKNSSDPKKPFIELPEMDFSIEWRALLHGKLVSEIYINDLVVNFTKLKAVGGGDSKNSSTEKPGNSHNSSTEKPGNSRISFAEKLRDLSPIDLNHFEISNARLAYVDPESKPDINIYLDHFNLIAKNLTNVVDRSVELPASIEVNSNIMETGRLTSSAKLNFLKEVPDFDFNLSIESLDMTQFNDYMDVHAKLRLKKGIMNLYTEAKAKNGKVKGYVKPVIEDIEIGKRKVKESIPQKLYNKLAKTVASLLENDEKETIATKVNITGNLNTPDVKVWSSIVNIFRNAFIDAYNKKLEDIISFDDEN